MVRQFTPNWFAATMGAGILALSLRCLPLARHCGSSTSRSLFSLLYGARWLFFVHEARRIFGHNTVSMFIGTIPMWLATIINDCLAFGIARFSQGIVDVEQALW